MRALWDVRVRQQGPKRTLFLGLAALILAAGASLARAQETTGSVDPAAELAQVEGALSTATETQADLIRRMAETIRAQEDLSGQLVALAQKAAGEESGLAQVTEKIAALNAENAEAELALARKRDQLSSLLAGLQRLEQNPPPALVVAPHDVLTALRGAMMFGAVIPDLRRQTDELKQALAHVTELRGRLAAEKDAARVALATLARTRSEIKRLLEQKKALAEQDGTALKSERERAKSLAARARTLKDLVQAFAKAKAAEEAARSAAEEAKLQAEAEAERLRQEALSRPPLRFSTAKGQLPYPVQGKIHLDFGANNGLGGRLEGVLLTTPPKSQVIAPVDGTVAFAGQFRSYDQVVIIDPGEGYLVLLAGMADITANPGQTVRAGEPVGWMGERPAALALAGNLSTLAEPVLYVEFRSKNRSIDPSPWWVAGRREAWR